MQAQAGNFAEASAGTPIVRGRRLLFTFQGRPGDQVQVVGGVNCELLPSGNQGLFVGDVRVPDLDKAIISYMLLVNGKPQRDPRSTLPPLAEGSPLVVFRGAKAPRPTALADDPAVARGTVSQHAFVSAALGEERQVWVYRPPGFSAASPCPILLAADGQTYFDGTVHLSRILDNLQAQGRIPAVAAIGIASSPDHRREEMIFRRVNFDRYQTMLRSELLPWLASEFKLAPPARGLVPLGFSNGGAWALYTSMIEPERFRGGIMQSALTTEAGLPSVPAGHRYYISAGTLDPRARKLQNQLVPLLQNSGNLVASDCSIGGHDFALFETQLVKALTWMFAC